MTSMVDLTSSSEHQQEQYYAFGHHQHQEARRASIVSTSSSSINSTTTARRASLASLMLPSRLPLAPLGPQMTPAFALADQQSPSSTHTSPIAAGTTTSGAVAGGGGFASFMAKSSSGNNSNSNSGSTSASSLLLAHRRRPSLGDDIVTSPYYDGHHSHVNGVASPISHLPRYVMCVIFLSFPVSISPLPSYLCHFSVLVPCFCALSDFFSSFASIYLDSFSLLLSSFVPLPTLLSFTFCFWIL